MYVLKLGLCPDNGELLGRVHSGYSKRVDIVPVNVFYMLPIIYRVENRGKGGRGSTVSGSTEFASFQYFHECIIP